MITAYSFHQRRVAALWRQPCERGALLVHRGVDHHLPRLCTNDPVASCRVQLHHLDADAPSGDGLTEPAALIESSPGRVIVDEREHERRVWVLPGKCDELERVGRDLLGSDGMISIPTVDRLKAWMWYAYKVAIDGFNVVLGATGAIALLPNLTGVNLELSDGAWWGVTAGAFTLGALRTTSNFRTRLALLSLTLNVTADVANDSRLRFSLFHVSDGHYGGDEVVSLLNVAKHFRRDDGEATRLKAKVRYERRLGCQFKCFADFDGLSFGEVKQLLEKQADITDVTLGGGEPNRAWFLLERYPVVETKEGFRNNFRYPA